LDTYDVDKDFLPSHSVFGNGTTGKTSNRLNYSKISALATCKESPMFKTLIIVILCCALCQVPASAGEPAIGDRFPADFEDKAFEHIAQLVAFGPRSPGAEGEERAFQYIRRQFEETGLDVRVEEFEYETFRIERIELTVGGEMFEVETIGFNPYDGQHTFEGAPLLVGPDLSADDLNQMDLSNRIVVTTTPVDYFGLMFRNPQLIVYVGNSDFAALADKDCSSCNLAVEGTLETVTSANIVAELAPKTPTPNEVIVSAHWDSYGDSPGADDNGSGVGVLIELAHFFATLEGDIGGTIKFISFGVEELGLLGSRAYLNTHGEDLQNCSLVFNIDQVGGPNGPAVEMLGGVQGIPERKGLTQFPAQVRNRSFEGPGGRWRLVAPDAVKTFMVTNHPVWLVNTIESSVEQLGVEIRPTGNFGADQLTFTQAGIVATGIGTSGNRYHSPEDVSSQIYKDNLEITGKIVANVVLTTLRDKTKK